MAKRFRGIQPIIPHYPPDNDRGAYAPLVWYGDDALDATDGPWYDAVPGSIYIHQQPTAANAYIKIFDTGAMSDWTRIYGGGSVTQANGAASAAQKVVTVDSTTGFLGGCFVEYALATGVIERNTVATVDSGTQITLGTNIGTGGIANNALIAVIPAGFYNASRGVYNVRDFGAVTGGAAATNTTAIQAAIDAAAVAGGQVLIPAGTYQINATLTISTKRGVWLSGTVQSYAAPGSGLGTTLQWAGAASDDMLYIFDCQDVTLEGICFDGADTAGVRAVFADSDNITMVTKRLRFDNLTFRRCNIGLQFAAAADGTQYQVDSLYLRNLAFSEMYGANSTCVHVQSQNCDMLNIENAELAGAVYGVRIVRGGLTRLSNMSGGILSGAFISLEGPCNNLGLTNCQAESATYFLRKTAGAPSDLTPIVLQGCTVDNDILIEQTARIVSIGSVYNADVTLAGNDVEFASIYDLFTSSYTIVKSGANCIHFQLDGTTGLQMNSGTRAIRTILGATATWDPANLANGATDSTTVTVTGAAKGNTVLVAHENVNAAGLFLTGTVASTNMVNVTLLNQSGGPVDVASGTLRVTVIKP